MPLPKPPRKPRGVPKHRRDLQTMEKPMPSLSEAAGSVRALKPNPVWSALGVGERKTKVDAAVDVGSIAGIGALGHRYRQQKQENKTLKAKLGVAKSGAIVDNATRVRRVQPRHPSGKFVSHTNDLMVIHPRYSTSRRAPRDSKLQCWGKGKDSQSKTYMGKADDGALAQAMTAGGARRGRRLA